MIIPVILITVIHWIADFVLQTDKEAKGKSKNWSDLLSHTVTYSFVWFIVGIVYMFFNIIWEDGYMEQNGTLLINCMVYFPLITFITHTTTDYFTSRLNSRLWAKGDVHNFFVSVGFDQVLHYVQLFLTYQILFN
jgi:hypothetical protein